MDNLLIGADKFGHFIQQGYEYFQQVYLEQDLYKKKLQNKSVNMSKNIYRTVKNIMSRPFFNGADYDDYFHLTDRGFTDVLEERERELINQALFYGVSLEDGAFGMATTSVKSHADLIANYNGMIWWTELTEIRLRNIRNPYFRCVNSKWKMVRQMDWSDYIDPLWDESVNCSSFSSVKVEKKVLRAVLEMKEYFVNNCMTNTRQHCKYSEKSKYSKIQSMLFKTSCEE
jgi:hypothetical protein